MMMRRWLHRLELSDIWPRGDEFDLELLRDEIVARMKAHRLYRESDTFRDFAEEIEATLDEDGFDAAWHHFYAYADHIRLWVNLIPALAAKETSRP